MNALVKVDFHGDTLLAQPQPEGPPLVAVKPIVERLGLDWRSQLQRLKRDEVLMEGVVMITTPSPGGPQDTVALPLNLIPGFLFGIDDSRIADPDTRRAVLVYKRECHDVLYHHFFGRLEDIDPTADWDWDGVAAKLSLVRETRLTHGRKVAASLWAALGLPLPGDTPAARIGPPSNGMEFVQSFLDECVVEEPRSRGVQAIEMKTAYDAWAEANGAPPMTFTGFGRTLAALELPKNKSAGRVFYTGIRLRHRSEITG